MNVEKSESVKSLISPHLEQADHWPQGVHSGQVRSLHSLTSSGSPRQSSSSPEHFRLLTASPSPQVTLQPAGHSI